MTAGKIDWILDALGRAFRGEEELVIVYWIYGVLVNAILVLLAFGLLQAAVRVNFEGIAIRLAGVVLAAVVVVYEVWSSVALWRCSYNTGRRVWGDFARAIVISAALLMLLVAYEGFQWVWSALA